MITKGKRNTRKIKKNVEERVKRMAEGVDGGGAGTERKEQIGRGGA